MHGATATSTACRRGAFGTTHARRPLDLIVIGPGGATLAQRLAPTGKQILMLERGNFLERAPDTRNPREVSIDNAHQANETWYDKGGMALHPDPHYFVGGNSKMYGAALFRLRERDFERLEHAEGISPEWPLKYDVFAPYCDQAAHQAATARFGTDPATSVLDLDGKAYEPDNLYVVDASYFPSIGAVNRTLTIIANALRVADRIAERLG